MHQTGNLAQVVKEMDKYRMDIIGISETRWTGSRIMKERFGHRVIHSGREDFQDAEGVAIIMSDKVAKALMEWKQLGERLSS